MTPAESIRLYFETKDVENACDRLEKNGVTIVQPPKMMPWGWKHAYVNDSRRARSQPVLGRREAVP
jgi:uncharacterized glyoxalase superfamily protein PhnB